MRSDVRVVDQVIEAESIPTRLFSGIERILMAQDDHSATQAIAAAVFSLVDQAAVTFTVFSEDEASFVVYDNYRNGEPWEWQVGARVPDDSLTNIMMRVKKPLERHVPDGSTDPWFLDYPDFFGMPVLIDEGTLVRAMTVGIARTTELPERFVYYLSLIAGFGGTVLKRITEVKQAVGTGQVLEREYILQELHDTAIQDIFSCELGLTHAIHELERTSSPRASWLRAELAECLSYVQRANHTMRDILNERSARRWSGMSLVSEIIQGEVVTHNALCDIVAVAMVEGDAEVGGNVARSIRMFFRECLCNARKHSGAERVVAFSTVESDVLSLCVADDGVGFDVSHPRAGSGDAPHFGLANLQETFECLGSSVSVESAPGEGCAVRAKLRLGEPR